MAAAGAVCVGALNMDEYAYGFTTENAHDGPCRNPHDPARIAGGSSGGSAAPVAAGLVPLSLGSDSNGSIRVPSSLCGIFGVKPTYGRLSRHGSHPFAAALDHLGPFARNVVDLALCYDALQGFDPEDSHQQHRPAEPVSGLLDAGIAGLCIAVADDHCARHGHPECFAAVEVFARTLGTTRLPVVAAPLADLAAAGTTAGLPIGVQVIAALWRKDLAFRVAAELARRGVAAAPRPRASAGAV